MLSSSLYHEGLTAFTKDTKSISTTKGAKDAKNHVLSSSSAKGFGEPRGVREPCFEQRSHLTLDVVVHSGASGFHVSDERFWLVPVAMHDRVGAHVRERLNGERRVEPAHRREGRTADDEQIRNVPALTVAIHHRCFRIAAHTYRARSDRDRSSGRRTADSRFARRAAAQGYTLLVLKSYVTKLSPTRGIISAYCAQGRE